MAAHFFRPSFEVVHESCMTVHFNQLSSTYFLIQLMASTLDSTNKIIVKILTSSNLPIFSNHSSYHHRICCGLVSEHRILWYRSTHWPIFSFYQNFTLLDYNSTSFDFDIYAYNLHFQRLRFPTIMLL